MNKEKVFIYPALNDEFNSVIVSSLMSWNLKNKKDVHTIGLCFNKKFEILYQFCDEVIHATRDLKWNSEMFDINEADPRKQNNLHRKEAIDELSHNYENVYNYYKEYTIHPYSFIFPYTCRLIKENKYSLRSTFKSDKKFDFVFLNRDYVKEKSPFRNADFTEEVKNLNELGFTTAMFSSYGTGDYIHRLNENFIYDDYNEQLFYMENAKCVFCASNAGGISTHLLCRTNFFCKIGNDAFSDIKGKNSEKLKWKGKNLKETREESWPDVKTDFYKEIDINYIKETYLK
jgi:hypothetical protein